MENGQFELNIDLKVNIFSCNPTTIKVAKLLDKQVIK